MTCSNLFSQIFEQPIKLNILVNQSMRLTAKKESEIILDTIVVFKRISIDTIFFNNRQNIVDTIFFEERFTNCWRYINGRLAQIDSTIDRFGLIFHGQRNGIWVETNRPSCFHEGTYSSSDRQYYHGQEIYTNFSDKYFFLTDTLSGVIVPQLYLEDTLYLRCTPNDLSGYYCSLFIERNKLLLQCPIQDIEYHLYGILSGEYRRKIHNLH
jgi:hypothetical protein